MVAHGNDIVPALPPVDFGYEHVGGPKGPPTIWLPANEARAPARVCCVAEDPCCATNIDEHLLCIAECHELSRDIPLGSTRKEAESACIWERCFKPIYDLHVDYYDKYLHICETLEKPPPRKG